jgi:amino acid adenylation domain-containing protein
MNYSLAQVLEKTAVRHPAREAVRCNGKGITYATLQQQVDNLAAILVQQGVQRGDRIGFYMNKDIESVVAIYGIMKAGAAYVPLDPYAPVSRLSYVINDCGVEFLVTKPNKMKQVREMIAETGLRGLIGVPPQEDLTQTCIPWSAVTEGQSAVPDRAVIAKDLAYILYTSGSTGTPKGIMHTHSSALSFAEWAQMTYALTEEDRVTNHAPYHFDLSTFDLFATMIAGGTVVIIPEFVVKFPASHSQLLQDEKITVSYTVPYALISLMERGAIDKRDLSALRWVLFAGEVFPTKHLRALMTLWPEKRFSNLYGPTETNVCTFYHVPPIPEGTDETIPIGIPCANEEALIVDEDNQEVAPGEVGELLIRGGTVMRGYWGRPDLNEKGFYRRPMFNDYEDIFYRTGDLVQELPDGNLRYLGRKDRQVKTRGYRVELDEVEVALLSHEAVQEAAVYTIPDGQGSNLIEAAVILRETGALKGKALQTYIGTQLPPYAVPVKIHTMEDFPRTSTGKINRRVLQSLAIEGSQ